MFIAIFVTFLIIPLLENIYAKDDFSKKSLSNISYQYIDNHHSEKNNDIPNQFIVYLQEENEQEGKSIDPVEFFNSELKNTGCELLQVYDNVVKGFAIKVPNEEVLEELKSNPLVEYIGQDKKISPFTDSPMEVQVIPQTK
jgi:hypothetical protein